MEKIFIDVTQSCRSSNNSGIQVVTRNLFREIKAIHDVVPIIWDNLLGRYSLLDKREMKNLINPFSGNYQAKIRPNKQENPFYRELLSSLLRFRKCLSLEKKPKNLDLIFFPEVFRDKRTALLTKLLHPELRKAAIFYDANVLRKPSQTPQSRIKNFQNYLNYLCNCDAISCISKESQEAFYTHTGQGKKIRQVKVHLLPMDKPTMQVEEPFPATPLILFVSTLGYNKNHLALLKAVEILWKEGHNFQIELIGQADPSWTPKVLVVLDRLVEKGRSVKWLHHIDQESLERKYSSCIFTVYPSLYEGFGLPIIESLIRGKPCICGTNGALGEVSTGGGCLEIKDQSNPHQLAEAIRKLITNKPLLQSLSTDALKRNFGSWKQYASDLIDLFLEEDLIVKN